MKHHAMLHRGNQSIATGSCTSTNVSGYGTKVCLRIVPVAVHRGSKTVQTYALLDAGSDVTLCSDSLVKRLDAKGKSFIEFSITTVNGSKKKKKGIEFHAEVSSIDGHGHLTLQRVWSVERLSVSLDSLPRRLELAKWDHLAGIELPNIDANEVGLLIGSDTPEAFWVEEERRGKRSEPYAILLRSILGWTIIGPTCKVSAHLNVNVHYQQADVLQQMHKLWSTDFPEYVADDKREMSQDDRRALGMMMQTITQEDGHYKIGLPWRDDQCFSHNKHMALTPLAGLKRKLQGNNYLHKMYSDSMEGYILKCHAKRVCECETESKSDRIWYLPHHPVVSPRKPGKVRVVFDCASKYKGMSLNDRLVQGPDLVNSIVGVRTRFREERIALVADIEAMFHQVRVMDEDCQALRFLWWPEGDLTRQPECHQMQVHLFGATSSPSCAAYALRRTATDNAEMNAPEVATTLELNFYVDDL
ncbi:uncharacterized protein LOC128214763 [Mya arenaria]|uniref:uncharacterized protein LOC128214763 n=1 Tax=Mya arenaria TaxID=6604 RepID=UPI0022DEFA1F|nr:uncharacterized protein LOC128214763 [Mya arenaria]